MNTQVISNSETPTLSRTELEQAERRAKRFWVTAIVGLLGLQVVVGITSLILAVGDPSVAVIPNYHQSALAWDATQRARHLTQKLGWQIVPMVGPVMPAVEKRIVQLQVVDTEGGRVTGLFITGKAYHHARGAAIHEMRFMETASGNYQATTSLTDAGLWQLQLQIEGNHGIASDTREITVE